MEKERVLVLLGRGERRFWFLEKEEKGERGEDKSCGPHRNEIRRNKGNESGKKNPRLLLICFFFFFQTLFPQTSSHTNDF